MMLPRFLQNRCQPIPSQGVVGNGQQIPEAQAAAVGHQDPRWQQDSVRAMQRTPRHLRGYRKQMAHLVMGPSSDHRKGVLDTADRACTIVHQQAVSEGGFSQGTEHTPVVMHGGGGEMTESVRQVRIDPIDSQIGHSPRQSLGQDDQLLGVSGAGAHPHGVVNGEVSEVLGHGVSLGGRGKNVHPLGTVGHPGKIATILHMAPLAQLDRVGRSSPLSGWLSRILRGAVLASLVTIIFLHGVGTLLTFLALGQLGRAAVLFRRGLRRDSVRRTDAASY